MSQDQQTYQRAVNASLVGLAIQVVVALVLLLLALRMDGQVLLTATWYAFGGVLLWVILAIVHQQHKLERIEAIEADALAQRHGTDSSIFQTSAEDLSVARRRLRRLEKWALPIVSLLTATYLIGVGAWQWLANAHLLAAQDLETDSIRSQRDPKLEALAGELGLDQPGIVLALLIGLAFVMFVVSRYLAGMAKVKQWQMLRGGAGYLMGVALVAVVIAVGYGLLLLPTPVSAVLRFMVVIVPVIMIAVGAEIALNLLLDVYRPRKPGDMPRPAFDSRLLSFLTSPESIARSINEAINYQFGFEITQSWFWQLFTKALPSLALISAAVLIALSSLVFVAEGEQAVVTRFGRLDPEPLGPGVYLKAPWPMASAQRYEVDRIQQIALGNDIELKADTPILWGNAHYEGKAPEPLIVATRPSDDEQADAAAERSQTPSVALINAEVVLQYRVRDLVAYLTHNHQPVERLRTLGDRELSRYLLSKDIDQWMSASRREAAEELRQRIQAEADAAQLGVEVVGVSVASLHPPQTVADAFHEVVKAEQQRQITIEQARAEAIATMAEAAGTTGEAESIAEMINRARSLTGQARAELELEIERAVGEAGGEAAEVLAEAKADRWVYENGERAAVLDYQQDLLPYRAAPEVYRLRAHLQTLIDGFAEARVYAILADPERFTVRMSLENIDAFGSFSGPSSN